MGELSAFSGTVFSLQPKLMYGLNSASLTRTAAAVFAAISCCCCRCFLPFSFRCLALASARPGVLRWLLRQLSFRSSCWISFILLRGKCLNSRVGALLLQLVTLLICWLSPSLYTFTFCTKCKERREDDGTLVDDGWLAAQQNCAQL